MSAAGDARAWARPILAGNWKMNLGPDDAGKFVASYLERVAPSARRTVVLFPPALSLAAARAASAGRADLQFGVQNVYWEAKGAFTGEISAPMARSAGAVSVLVGHSERRHVFHESDADTGRKCEAVVAAALTPVLCVGELLSERESGRTSEVVLRQLRAGLSRLTAEQVAGMVIAYEPVWAIGTGRTATPTDASETHTVLRAALTEMLPASASTIPILYGGSVNAGNAPSLLAAPNVDGLLVGGASLDPSSWAQIVLGGQ
jgi:triosephosphate isomerase (TIM)